MTLAKYIKRNDVILIIFLLIIGIIMSLIIGLSSRAGSTVKITVDGRPQGRYPLNVDATIPVENHGHLNIVEIKNGKVKMTSSDCPNKICLHQAPIHTTVEAITCLPHGVVVQIEGGKEDYDAVSR